MYFVRRALESFIHTHPICMYIHICTALERAVEENYGDDDERGTTVTGSRGVCVCVCVCLR